MLVFLYLVPCGRIPFHISKKGIGLCYRSSTRENNLHKAVYSGEVFFFFLLLHSLSFLESQIAAKGTSQEEEDKMLL